jgi:hypothetical protein
VIFDVAAEHRLNVAAPVYGVKKSQALPAAIAAPNGKTYDTIDGDVTDWRRDDGWIGQPQIVGLRLKRTPGQTEAPVRIDPDGGGAMPLLTHHENHYQEGDNPTLGSGPYGELGLWNNIANYTHTVPERLPHTTSGSRPGSPRRTGTRRNRLHL